MDCVNMERPIPSKIFFFEVIFWFAYARDLDAKFSIRRNISYFFEPGRIFGMIRLRRNKQQIHEAP